MNRNGLIVLQVIGGLSILPYPFVLIANIMSMAATGHTPLTTLFWGLMCLYPLAWIALWVISWMVMKQGAVGLAFGLSSIPVFACVLVVGVLAFSWISIGLGSGGVQSKIISHPTHDNPVLAAVLLAGQDVQVIPETEAVDRALKSIDAHPDMVNVSDPQRGSPLNVALESLSINVDGSIIGAQERKENRLRMVRALVAKGAHLNADEARDLRETWNLKRALYDGPVATSSENALVWRIVTHGASESKPFNVMTDKLPERGFGPAPFALTDQDTPLLNKPTRLHGTPLYAALLDKARETSAMLIKAGGRLSPEEDRDPAAHQALEAVFATHNDLRAAYNK